MTCRSQMISAEDCEFIKKFEVANSEEKQVILTNEGHQVFLLKLFFKLTFSPQPHLIWQTGCTKKLNNDIAAKKETQASSSLFSFRFTKAGAYVFKWSYQVEGQFTFGHCAYWPWVSSLFIQWVSWLCMYYFCSVCKDLLEPDGPHLQGANRPVHPDSDWRHSAGTWLTLWYPTEWLPLLMMMISHSVKTYFTSSFGINSIIYLFIYRNKWIEGLCSMLPINCSSIARK